MHKKNHKLCDQNRELERITKTSANFITNRKSAERYGIKQQKGQVTLALFCYVKVSTDSLPMYPTRLFAAVLPLRKARNRVVAPVLRRRLSLVCAPFPDARTGALLGKLLALSSSDAVDMPLKIAALDQLG